ncbi:hypothetical protein HDV05_000048 [Chytridiales sp. JEL 0842]|nr:hypothetical protein HDV05_000048 [Chytridiales sp. JEL 0842]
MLLPRSPYPLILFLLLTILLLTPPHTHSAPPRPRKPPHRPAPTSTPIVSNPDTPPPPPVGVPVAVEGFEGLKGGVEGRGKLKEGLKGVPKDLFDGGGDAKGATKGKEGTEEVKRVGEGKVGAGGDEKGVEEVIEKGGKAGEEAGSDDVTSESTVSTSTPATSTTTSTTSATSTTSTTTSTTSNQTAPSPKKKNIGPHPPPPSYNVGVREVPPPPPPPPKPTPTPPLTKESLRRSLEDLREGETPYTSGLRGLLSHRLLTPLIGPHCTYSLLSFHLTDIPCIRLLISKTLGIGLVAGGAIIKLPQLYKIVKKKSALGVSFESYVLETGAYIAGLAYNVRRGNPFNTYGEHAFMAVANVLVIALMFHYKGKHQKLVYFLAASFGFSYSLFTPSIVSDALLLFLQWVAIGIGVFSKVPQILENHTTRSTGQLSAVTVFLQTIGSLARCFTTATEVKDGVILLTYVVATLLNGTVLYQVYTYWGRPKRTLVEKMV